jgi:O-antigen ligase
MPLQRLSLSLSGLFRLNYLSLVLVGLMWVLPFLNYHHQYPLTTFDQEWWCALLGILSLTALLDADYWHWPGIPRIVQLPAGLMVIVMVQSALGMLPYLDQALLYLLYFLFGLLLMSLGARLRKLYGIENLALVLAGFLLVGAELSALIGVLQHFGWHTILDPVVVAKMSFSVYGNIAQPNHFADYIALGLISLGLLFQQKKLALSRVVILVFPLLFVMTLSGSRSSWLYLLIINVLAWYGARRLPELRPLLRYCQFLLAGLIAMHGVVELPFLKGAGNSYNMLNRVVDASSGGIRLYLWHEAWLIFKQSSLLGAGFGQFAWQHFLLGPQLQRINLTGLYNNAHNLIFQLAAETGLAGLLVFFAAIGVWLQGQRHAFLSAAQWWGYAILSVLAIHSMLEYPLWYLYFFAIAAFLLGALDETHYRLELRRTGRWSMAFILLLGMLQLFQLQYGYRHLRDFLVASAPGGAREGLLIAANVPLLSPYADMFMSTYFEVNNDNLDEKLAINSRLVRYLPVAQVANRQACLLALKGQSKQARDIMQQRIWSYPEQPSEHQPLIILAQKDPAHFASLLEFTLKVEQERVSAIHNN